jgi:excisionase family DNA binding protein
MPFHERAVSPALVANGDQSAASVTEQEHLWDVAEVLRYLGISRATLDRHVSSGKIPTCQLSSRGRRFFRKSDIDAALSPQLSVEGPAADVDFIRNRIGKGAP